RLPVVHSEEIVTVLEKMASQPRKLSGMEGLYFATQCWNETTAQRDGTIRRETLFPSAIDQWIISGPHFFIGTPLNKTPNANCANYLDSSYLGLRSIPDPYLPRTNHVPACPPSEYRRRIPHFGGKPVTDCYRHIHRRQLSLTGERALVNAIAPPGVTHIDG